MLALDAADGAVERGAPYARYHASAETIFPVALTRTELKPKQLVYGLEQGFRRKAWTADALLAARGHERRRSATSPSSSSRRAARSSSRPPTGSAPSRFSPGAEIRAYARGTDTFRAGASADELLDAGGAAWQATDAGLVSEAGTTHRRLPGTSAYWFAWQAFHPDTELGAAAE